MDHPWGDLIVVYESSSAKFRTAQFESSTNHRYLIDTIVGSLDCCFNRVTTAFHSICSLLGDLATFLCSSHDFSPVP